MGQDTSGLFPYSGPGEGHIAVCVCCPVLPSHNAWGKGHRYEPIVTEEKPIP